jgi:hypothetical protein
MLGVSQLITSTTSAPTLGDALGQQVANETDDERRKRMALMQQNQMLGPAGSLAVTSLLGATGGKSAGY